MSSSTGYPQRIITMEQPTSSGQISAVQDGCAHHYEDGAAAIFKEGAVIREAVASHSSASTSISWKGGHKVIGSTIANTFNIKRPMAAGEQFSISVVNTSFVQTFHASTAKLALFGASTALLFAMVVAPTSVSKDLGCHIDLVALSTVSWAAKVAHTTSLQVTFTSAT